MPLRLLSGILLFTHLMGAVWFADTLTVLWWVYVALMCTSLGLVTLVPKPRQGRLRLVGPLLLLATGVVTGFVLLTDVQLSGGPDFGAIALRITALVVITLILFRANPECSADSTDD